MTGTQMTTLGAWFLRLGSLSLLWRTWQLAQQALRANLKPWHLAWILPVAAVVGLVKARLVMRPRMEQNVRRLLTHAERLRPWQLYPPQLFAFILAMILLLRWATAHFAQQAMPLALLSGVDLAVAAALISSASVYRMKVEEADSASGA